MDTNDIQRIKAHCSSLFFAAETDKATWVKVVNEVFPEIVDAAYLRENYEHDRKRVCSHARSCILTLASAMMSYVFPQGHRWFRFGAPDALDEASKKEIGEYWMNQTTDTAFAAIERSNFYPEMHGVTIDRCATGTGLLYIDADPEDGRMLQFTHVPSGTYGIGEDSQHRVNTVARKIKYTLAQLIDEFGEENLSPSAQVAAQNREQLHSVEAAREIWHIVMPRDLANKAYQGLAADERPWASLYIDPQDDFLMVEDGLYEFPYMCTRFVRYGNKVYGTSPLKNVEDKIHDLLIDEECLTMLNQRVAMPPMVSPAELADQIDWRAGSITVMPTQYIGSQVPRELAPVNMQGLQFMQLGAQEKRQAISDACFTSILQNVTMQDRAMTATEVSARESEKATNYYPTFTQLQIDMRPFCNRVFGLLARAGEFDLRNAPRGVVQQYIDRDGVQRDYILSPTLVFIGKMSQALERVQSSSAQSFFGMAFQMFAALQDANMPIQFDWSYIIRDLAIKSGMPADYLLSKEKADQKAKEVQEALMAQQQAIAEQNMANADAKRAQAQNARLQYAR